MKKESYLVWWMVWFMFFVVYNISINRWSLEILTTSSFTSCLSELLLLDKSWLLSLKSQESPIHSTDVGNIMASNERMKPARETVS